MSSVSNSIKSQFGLFQDDQKGAVAAVFGLTTCVLMATAGAAVDLGRAIHARNQTQAAMDAAVLAGARHLQLNGMSDNSVVSAISTAKRFYKENVAQRIDGVVDPGPAFAVGNNNTTFEGSSKASIKTVMLSAFSGLGLETDTLPVNVDAAATVALGQNSGVNLEVSMMLDTSSSMTGQKLTDLKTAAADLVNIVVWDDQSEFTSRIALAPFSADVRLPAGWNTLARGAPPATKIVGGSVVRRTACVGERHGTQRFTDAAPASGQFVTTKYTSNGVCNQPANNEPVALSDDKDLLTSRIQNLSISNGTAGHLGTAWAWYMLSPNWSQVFPSSAAPTAYGAAATQKIAILMTDGEYNTQYSASGVSGTSPNGNSSTQATSLCSSMKAQGITVYTVGFDLGGNNTAIGTLQNCATSPAHFYNAGDGSALQAAFRDIALKLSNLRLSK
jgi:Flp pilus assembly protein TadG